MDKIYDHSQYLIHQTQEWITETDFVEKYKLAGSWFQGGKKVKLLLYEEARRIEKEGSDYLAEHVQNNAYSPHLRALLIRAYKKAYPSYRLPEHVINKD